MAKNIDFMGATFPDVPSIRLPQHEGGLVSFTDVTDTTAVAGDVAAGKYFYNANGEKTEGTASGGSANIEALSVTQNGTYTASGGVDGYSPVTVNVSGGGGSNYVTGEFTVGSTGGQVETVTIPYTGTGYPIYMIIAVKGGLSSAQGEWSTIVKRYAVGLLYADKWYKDQAPTYDSGDENKAAVTAIYKNSSSSATIASVATGSPDSYKDANPVGNSATACVRFKGDNKTLAYYTANGNTSSYGLLPDITYVYTIVYSQ